MAGITLSAINSKIFLHNYMETSKRIARLLLKLIIKLPLYIFKIVFNQNKKNKKDKNKCLTSDDGLATGFSLGELMSFIIAFVVSIFQ